MQNGQIATGKITRVRISPEMTDALWRVVKEVQAHDILAPVTIVGPTRYANLALRHELGSHGFVNVRFIVMSQLSELLGAGSLGRSRPGESSPDPLTEVVRAVSIRQVCNITRHPCPPSAIIPPLGPGSCHASENSAVPTKGY